MTEAMPFLQKTILLSYDPRPLAGGIAFSEFRVSVLQGLIVHGALAADELGPHPGRQHNGLTDVILLQPHRHRHLFQVHPDQRAAYVQTGVSPDLLQRHRMPEALIGGGGEGAARLGLKGTTLTMSSWGTASCSTISARFRCSQHWAAM